MIERPYIVHVNCLPGDDEEGVKIVFEKHYIDSHKDWPDEVKDGFIANIIKEKLDTKAGDSV